MTWRLFDAKLLSGRVLIIYRWLAYSKISNELYIYTQTFALEIMHYKMPFPKYWSFWTISLWHDKYIPNKCHSLNCNVLIP